MERKLRSMIPLGASAAVFGAIGYFRNQISAFDAIQAAGDISPSLVAGGMLASQQYAILGLLSLGIALVFKYVNS